MRKLTQVFNASMGSRIDHTNKQTAISFRLQALDGNNYKVILHIILHYINIPRKFDSKIQFPMEKELIIRLDTLFEYKGPQP